ncbi:MULTISPECIES: DUF2891 domain-containing protein [Oscillatoriales]|uniref:DUF2891 domain-containing protein n=1 Tax=Oscillatoriales TaxID=1150 RepID=UPI0004062C77|nr:hypothetical protein APPUASWS_003645 [Arthrospira platensis str. Paraca]MDT9309910.1 DUF2891 domain-containing protein [Limnospira sp. Paracas R14]
MKTDQVNPTVVLPFVRCALGCIHREYPHVHFYGLSEENDLVPHRQLNPAFYGCLDWHSAVHNHWLLVRVMRCFPEVELSEEAREKVSQNLTTEAIAQEADYLKDRPEFECPYGLGWLLQLTAELRGWNDSQGKQWGEILQPLEEVAVNNLRQWLLDLACPNRSGTHIQTAFAMGLIWDWAKATDNQDLAGLVKERAKMFYHGDRNYPLHIEPLGCDFLSPTLAEADLMRRFLDAENFANWLGEFLPNIPETPEIDWLSPVIPSNPTDYQQSHFDGLNLSRAWMLEGIIAGLPPDDPRISSLQAVAAVHRRVGLEPVSLCDYAGSHWLGSFAVYLLTQRGLGYT